MIRVDVTPEIENAYRDWAREPLARAADMINPNWREATSVFFNPSIFVNSTAIRVSDIRAVNNNAVSNFRFWADET